MAKRNVMEALNITPDGKQSLNPFGLENFVNLHCKSGQFIPCGMRKLVPNSKVNVFVDAVTRTKLCNTANFSHIKENYYFVFVPDALIYSGAYMMSVEREEPYSAIRYDITQMPTFNLGDVVYRCIEMSKVNRLSYPQWYDEHGFNIGVNGIRMLDLLGFGNYSDLLDLYMNNPYKDNTNPVSDATILATIKDICDTIVYKPSVASIAQYQCAWYHFFRNDIYDNDTDASIFNFDDCMVNGSAVYNVDEFRGLDNFILNCLRLRYVQNKKDIYMGGMPGTQYGAVSTVNLQENSIIDMDGVLTDFDYWQYNSAPDVWSNGTVTGRNVVGGSNVRLKQADSVDPSLTNGIRHQHPFDIDADDQPTLRRGATLFDVLQLVESQAIQKWRQKSMLAGQRTKDQYKAHYGVVPRHLQDHLPDFIGSVDNEIHVKEITSQSNTAADVTTESNLGEIRGRGYGLSDKRHFQFYSTEHGTLFLFKSIVVENLYSSYGLDPINTLVYPTDFYRQENQNIGLQVVPKYTLDVLDNSIVTASHPHVEGGDTFIDVRVNGATGMAPNFYLYKQKVSKVHGLFNPSRIRLRYYDPDDDPQTPNYQNNKFGYDDLQSFVVPRGDMFDELVISQNSSADALQVILPEFTMSKSKLYQNPHLVDSIFAVDADDNFDTDMFFSDIYFSVDALQPMSSLGLPQF